MKKIISSVLTLCIILSVFCVCTLAKTSENTVYAAPLASKAPKLDGKATDDCWKNALTIDLSPTSVVKNGGWAQNKKGGTATGTVKVVWTSGKKGGMYFLWQISDKTQSFCFDKGVDCINMMDCCQIALDPLYTRRAKLTMETCQVYTFAPYCCYGGNGFSVETQVGGSWWEHYCWVGCNESIGVDMAVKLQGQKDNKNKADNRKYLVTGYTIEAYIPFSAMQVKGGTPDAQIGTKIGIGFLMVDYDYNYAKWQKAGSPTTTMGDYIELLNISSDYTNGSGTNRNNICSRPKNYNTLYLADASGKLPGGTATETTTVVKTSEAATVPVIEENATLSDIIATADALEQELYTADSFAVVSTALATAKAFTDTDTSADAVAAKEALVKAIDGLVLATETKDETTAPEDGTEASTETIEEATTAPTEDTTENSFPLWIIIIAVAVVAAIVVIIIIASKKKKNSNQ